MLVNTKQLKEDLDLYSNLLSEYENNYLNYYNVISSFSFFWSDEHSKKFFNSIPKEKNYCQNMLNELKSIKEVYKYLYTKYSKFGKQIYIDLKNEDSILLKFDRYLEKANSIIHSFNNLNLSFCPELRPIVQEQKDNFLKTIEKMRDNRVFIKKYFEEIRNIEQTVKMKLKNLEFVVINETNISGMIQGDFMHAKMDIVWVENTLIKYKAYKIEEIKNLEKIKIHLDKLLSNYSSDNKYIFTDKISDIENKFNVITRIHNNNNTVIRKNLDSYLESYNNIKIMGNR